jgi:hypothetical protein
MSARVPRTIRGIADALSEERRMEFYRQVLAAEAGQELQNVIATWWGHAMLDTDPDRERVIAAVEAGTLPTVTMDEVIRRRIANGGEVRGEADVIAATDVVKRRKREEFFAWLDAGGLPDLTRPGGSQRRQEETAP